MGKNLKGQFVIADAQKETGSKVISSILRERIDLYGVDNLMDEEVIALLTGANVEVIREGIQNFGLRELYQYMNALDLTKAQARKLELLSQYFKRMITSDYLERPILNSSVKAGEYCGKLFVDKSYECFYVVSIDAQNRVCKAHLVHEGTINEAPIYPRIIIESALNHRANSVILSHNHPGGSLRASTADIEATKRIKAALEAISIKVVDHVIVAEDKYISFAEEGIL